MSILNEVKDLYAKGFTHEEIVKKTNVLLSEVRSIISKATRDDENLYTIHMYGEKRQKK